MSAALRFPLIALVLALSGCGNPESPQGESQAGVDVCRLLKAEEVAAIAGHDLDAGETVAMGDGVRQCRWPARGRAELIVQVMPGGRGGVHRAAAVGEGFLVLDAAGAGAPAAVSFLNPAPGSGLSSYVGILAADAGPHIVRVVPLGLDVVYESDRYDQLLQLARTLASRMQSGEVPASPKS